MSLFSSDLKRILFRLAPAGVIIKLMKQKNIFFNYLKSKLKPEIHISKLFPSRLFFPHYLRIFPDSFFFKKIQPLLLMLLVILACLNFFHSAFFPLDLNKKLLLEIQQSPQDSSLHVKLGKLYLNNNKEEALKEFILADNLLKLPVNKNSNLLGAQTSVWKEWEKVQNNRNEIINKIHKWELVHFVFPDYKYVSLKLSSLHYRLGEKEKSLEYLNKIFSDDPNNKEALILLGKVNLL